MKLILILCLSSLASWSAAQTICDSVSVAPDTVYLDQSTDSTSSIVFTYIGNADISYSSLSFEFLDTSNMNISDLRVTSGTGVNFTHSWTYNIVYNSPSIPPNTIVNCEFKVYRPAFPDTLPPTIDCGLPMTYIINSNTGIEKEESPWQINIYPNPATTEIIIDLENDLADKYSIDFYMVLGQKIKTTETDKDKIRIDVSTLPKGIYFVVISDAQSIVTRKLIIK